MNPKQSLKVGVACVASVGLCFLYAFTRDQLPDWWRNHGGGVPYVLFWILLWLTVIPRKGAVVYISLFCVLASCSLELFQLWDGPPWFNDFRRTRFGAAWLGYGYDPKDIPPYFIGGALGWLVGALLLRTFNGNRVAPDAVQPDAEQQ